MNPRFFLLCVLVLAGCVRNPADIKLQVTEHHNLPEPKIAFLGVGGWLVHWKGEGLLLAPSFSNPAFLGIKGIPPLRVRANNRKIDIYMPPANDVKMLLVGHAHYDHLMDVRRVMEVHTPHAKVIGSETVAHILAVKPRIPVIVPGRAEITKYDDPTVTGTWFYSSGDRMTDGQRLAKDTGLPPTGFIRAMPLESMHAGHLFRENLLPGAYDNDLEKEPIYIRNWKLGHKTLAWVIDLLGDDGKPVYRLHYLDSAANPPYGFPPLIADSKPFDVEILSAGDWEQVSSYPDSLLRVTRPRLVLVGHWENFFGNNLEAPAQTIPGQTPLKMIERIKRTLPGIEVVVPEPLSEVALPAAQ
ncbi:hypothetical protein T3H00_19710 [Pseudomonas fluorescens]|uniref:hypothetical protein n=1 Tax=Pseudomonas fluorescens TaxID=294 RepID=UPI002ACA9516|nr:hypothetical protein [Pseudomonas fluorescens]MDZ5434880.1 hypothetical protein [Pseudomonas fluorescens]